VGSQTDITPRKEAEERLSHEGFHDKVTGLANRSLFIDRLTNVLDRVKRQPGYLFAVLYVDLDRFSAINERVGHEPADRLLQTVAARLRSFARVGDTVARLGDDEFGILLDGIANDRAAVVFAERMRELIASPCDVGPEEVTVTASMGITLNSPDSTSAETLLNEAESAMQRAKHAGKNCQELFSRETYSRLVSKLRVETELRHAAERGELQLYYQPIFSIAEARIISLEALIRWNHPQRGMVSPLEFIPVAEETGLILNVGDWVMNEVSEQTRKWHEAGHAPVGIAINFSPRQFQQQNLLTMIGSTLAKCRSSGFPLELEITEGAAMHDVDQSVKILRSLREMGLRISIDDFGVGYSSLSCLRLFPLNTLKIDRGFVQGVPKVKDNTAITNAIIGIAHSLGLTVVAEGVETEEQLKFLRDQGCEEAQGYLLGRPMPAKDIAPILPKAKLA
jgi:diguanylate cyclase (GGDEF)-like protein